MNNLDLLISDLLEMILDKSTDYIDNEINILKKKMNLLKTKLKPLSINYSNDKYQDIQYDNIFYCITEYLFSNFKDENEIILINVYNDMFGGENGITYISEIMYKPTYIDILIEVNKSFIITCEKYHIFFDGLYNIPHERLLYILNYEGIEPKNGVKYYEILLGS